MLLYESLAGSLGLIDSAMRPNLLWLSNDQWSFIQPFLPTDVRVKARVDDRRVISGIVFVIRSGFRWCDIIRRTVNRRSPASPARVEGWLRGSARNNISRSPSHASISFARRRADRKQYRFWSVDQPCDASQPSDHHGTGWPRQSKKPPLASAES